MPLYRSVVKGEGSMDRKVLLLTHIKRDNRDWQRPNQPGFCLVLCTFLLLVWNPSLVLQCDKWRRHIFGKRPTFAFQDEEPKAALHTHTHTHTHTCPHTVSVKPSGRLNSRIVLQSKNRTPELSPAASMTKCPWVRGGLKRSSTCVCVNVTLKSPTAARCVCSDCKMYDTDRFCVPDRTHRKPPSAGHW